MEMKTHVNILHTSMKETTTQTYPSDPHVYSPMCSPEKHNSCMVSVSCIIRLQNCVNWCFSFLQKHLIAPLKEKVCAC